MPRATRVSPDGLVWTITLRDAKFHDGSPITAEDVVYSFRRLLTIKRGPSAAFLPVLAPDKITAVDAKTVKFELKHAYQPFHSALPLVCIVNPRVIKANEKDGDWGQAWLASNAAGSGPYMLDAESYKPDEAARHEAQPGPLHGLGAQLQAHRYRPLPQHQGDEHARQRAHQGRHRRHRQLPADRPGRARAEGQERAR